MTNRCIFCGKDNDDGPGLILALFFVGIGLVMAIGFFQFVSWFRWLCGWGG